MLKIYNIHDYVSIDGANWREVGGWGHCVADDTKVPDTIHLGQMSFGETREYLSKNHLSGVWNDGTFWLNKPIINVNYNDAWEAVAYRCFDTFAYKRVFTEKEDTSMDFLMKELSADQFIQYLKERGITTCPMNF